MIAIMSAYFKDPQFAWQTFKRDVQYTTIRFGTLWLPVMADVRALPGFHNFLRQTRLVDYWRRYGWSDFCWPQGDEDFVCGGNAAQR